MHCALATYLCCLMQQALGPGVFVLAALVAVSCLLVKQHQIADVVPGAALGWIASVVARSF
jgi:membrane-associated phospholipid phosphatase